MRLTSFANNLFLVCLFISGVMQLHGQTPLYPYKDLDHNYKTDFTTLRATGVAYTGYDFTLYSYPNNTDTQTVTFYVNGRTEWVKRFYTSGKLQQHEIKYHHGFRDDSICSEWVRYSEEKGDTTDYGYAYIDGNGVKWDAYRSYYPRETPGEKLPLRVTSAARYFTKKETRGFTGKEFKDQENYDSAGYFRWGYATGIYTMYYENGFIRQQGRNSTYEYALTHHGERIPGPYGGKTGVWTNYDSETGKKMSINVFDEAGYQVESEGYYPDGSMYGHTWYNKVFSEIHLASPDTVRIDPTDTCYRVNAMWYENGQLKEVDISTIKRVKVEYDYYSNGNPARFESRLETYGYNPLGIFREWDEQGHPTRFVNYTETTNDTICYIGEKGQITEVNLRDKADPMPQTGNNYYFPADRWEQEMHRSTVVHRAYFLNGQMRREVFMKDGKCNGDYSEWNESGTLVLKAVYLNGLPNGDWNEWHDNGKPKKVFHYRNGIRDGVCSEYHANGNLKWENTYVNGVPGKGKAYTENGTLLNTGNYLEAFYPQYCIEQQVKMLRPTALYYYFLDSASCQAIPVIQDSTIRDYAMKFVILSAFRDPDSSFCNDICVRRPKPGFDAYHSCFAITASLYSDTNQRMIAGFFERYGIKIDSTKPALEPLFGDNPEILVYYSSENVLNKQVVADSLEWYLFANVVSVNGDHIVHLDGYVPEVPKRMTGLYTTVTTKNGYTTITMEAGNPRRSGYEPGQYYSGQYIVYDDLSCDLRYEDGGRYRMLYWPLTYRYRW